MKAEAINDIRFTVISPERVRKMSVAKLIVPDAYNEDGYPIDGGLIDQRLGVIEPGLRCKTCGGRAKSCPGHFGHIELVRPVVHPAYAKTIYMLLQSTCNSCHRALMSESAIRELKPVMETITIDESDELLKAVEGHPQKAADATDSAQQDSSAKEANHSANGISSTIISASMPAIKRLKSVKVCPHCKAPQAKIKFEKPTRFMVGSEALRPDDLRDWLTKIPDDDLGLFGIDPKATRPEWFIITALLVPPVNVRPSITLESGERSEDDLTHKLVDIMRVNRKLEQDIDAGAPQIIIDDQWELLQYHVTSYFDNETAGIPVSRHRSGRPLKTLAQRLKGKEGRLRYNLSGKRVNFSARSVITPDPRLSINQVGIPIDIAKGMSVPMYVTKWNIDELKGWVEHTEYPLVVNVISKDGVRKRITETNRAELLAAIEPGTILERQLIDGDIALFNRQPTLHRVSIMAHIIKVVPDKTLRLNPSIAHPYTADFDGDEMNVHIPQSLEAQAEARYLMQPKLLLLSARDSTPISSLSEEQVMGMYLLTQDVTELNKEEASELLSYVGITELPEPLKNGKYSGKDLFSTLLPEDFSIEQKAGKDNVITIKNGKLKNGYINHNAVGGHGFLIVELFDTYGPDYMNDFLTRAINLALKYTYMRGISLSIHDFYITDEMRKEREKLISSVKDNALSIIEKYKQGKLEAQPGYTVKETYKMLLLAELDSARDLAVSIVNKHFDYTNNLFLMSEVHVRGDIRTIVQTSLLLGQQTVRADRPSRGYNGRAIPYIRRNDDTPESKGFIKNSFFDGLDPIELYLHAMGARASMQSKSLRTAVSGYLMRRLINAMQDFYVEKDMSVRGAGGALLQTVYGGDGMDPMIAGIAAKKKR